MTTTEEKLGPPDRFCQCCRLPQYGGTYCPNCGDDLEEIDGYSSIDCARCGEPMRSGTLYCGACGQRLIPTGVWWRFVTSLLWLVGIVQALLLSCGERIARRFANRR